MYFWLACCGQIVKKLPLEKKEVDDVLGGEDAWKDADRTTGMEAQLVGD